MILSFRLNGQELACETSPDRRVVDLLREDLGLAGSKECCGSGECGACTILVDGESRLSCLMLAAQLSGRNVVTIEGVAESGELHAIQKGFIDYGAIQCGFCTPGMVLASLDLLRRIPDPTREQVRRELSGNLCRCSAYPQILEAIRDIAGEAA